MVNLEIIQGFSLSMIPSLFLAFLAAWLFWDRVVPRQLKGLQVAFKTGDKRYEVHQVTESIDDVKHLLSLRGMRFGVLSYLMALTGSLLFLFEFLAVRMELSQGFHAPSVALALMLIILPAILSSGTSLGAQVIRPLGTVRATMQNNTRARNAGYVALTISWLLLATAVGLVLNSRGVSQTHQLSIAALVAFSPAILAYGRILGSSWHALKQSSQQISKGKSSPFHNHLPNARQQFIAQVVHLNLVAMPFVAINTLVSLLILLYDPTMFTHSDRVLNLPEYRLQSTYMEEGGLLGFGLIELFSHIPQAGIRVPIVTSLLLFLLLNVAAVGFLFVYEVARILFLDIQDVSGVGGIRLADSRLLRAEPVQQASLLNFCFTGFAGQSMLLLALAMITFWDSSFLPQGAACGAWESSVCSILEKNMLEELTWMLASGGQVAFLAVWSISLRRSGELYDISFDASMDEDRTRLRGMSDMIYVKQRSVNELVAAEDWDTALKRYETLSETKEVTLVGLDMVRKTKATMLLFAALGRWDEAEETAIDLLALKGGRDAQISRMVLCAASLAQRDMKEARPRLDLLPDDDIEAVRLKWISTVLNKKGTLNQQTKSMLSIDPLTTKNIEMLRQYGAAEISTPRPSKVKTAIDRRTFLSEIARMRMVGKSEYALNLLEEAIEVVPDIDWVHGRITQSLLNFDVGRVMTAVDLAERISKEHPRNPHVRSIIIQYAALGHTTMPSSEHTKIEWLFELGSDWRITWPKHTVAPAPVLESDLLRQHAWAANAWVGLASEKGLEALQKSRRSPHNELPDELPLALYTHLSGLLVTIGGMPVDLGLPGTFDLNSVDGKGLLTLS
ncbi:hypothetical protein N9V31_01260 [Candidatus Poseidonia alphae]|nr:hypothetical protein [Candidatus Poseidonia alphae]